MSDSNNNIGQDGKNNTQTNNITNNYNPINDSSNFSALLGSNIAFNHSAFNEIIPLIYQYFCKDENSQDNDFSSISMDEKNKINNFSKLYFKDVVEADYYHHFDQLEKLIQLKENKQLQQQLVSITKSFKARILALQIEKAEVKFEQILLNISEIIISKNRDIMKDKESEIMLLLYYFYTSCSIGKKQ